VAALQQAIDRRQPAAGMVHHSDQGVQYACSDYVELLRTHGLVPSMSRPAESRLPRLAGLNSAMAIAFSIPFYIVPYASAGP
jgi:transposase InsO family protein